MFTFLAVKDIWQGVGFQLVKDFVVEGDDIQGASPVVNIHTIISREKSSMQCKIN